MKTRHLFIFLCSLSLFLLGACSKKTDQYNLSDPKLYTEYINGFTSGIISSKDPIDISINENWGNWTPNQELDEKLFSTVPSVKGKTYFLPGNVIRFVPAERLKQDQKYNITFHLSKVAEVKNELKNFSFLVISTPLNFSVELLDLQSSSENEYMLNGTFYASDWVNTQQVKNILSASQGNKALNIKINADEKDEAKEFAFIISDIQRPETSNKIILQLDGKSVDVDQKETLEKEIPEKNVQRPFAVHQIGSDNQSFWINFSNPLKKNQNFDGLVEIANSKGKLTFTTEGNLLKVYNDQPFLEETRITVFPGIEDQKGQKNQTQEEFTLYFGIQKPDVRLIKSGSILPSSENLKIYFQATSLKAVDIKVYKIFENNILQFLQENTINGKYNLRRVASPVAKTTFELTNSNPQALLNWNSYALDLSALISPDPGAIYRVEFSFKKAYSLYNCPESDSDENEDITIEDNDEEIDDYDDYYYYYGYKWEEKDDPCADSYYYYREQVAANVLASDLGVIAKRGNENSYFFTVNNIITTEPVNNAKIELYSFQQQLLTTLSTDTNGMAQVHLDNQKAYFAIAKKNESVTYIKLDDGNALSMSNYNVDGQALQKGLNGFMYTERGVWRPGDNIYVSFILDDSANPIPDNHPIKITFRDPFGKIVDQQVKKKNPANHYTFTLGTTPEAVTGNWEAMVSVGGARFYKSIKIETIKPNRLKLKNNIEGKTLSATSGFSSVLYNVQWLQGTIAKNLKAEVQMKLIPQKTTFKGFEKYSFNNSLSVQSSEDINIFTGRTDQEGNFNFKINSNYSPENSGMLKAIFTAKVYENGGDVSTDVSTASFSPYKEYVGIKAPETNKYGYLETDDTQTFSIVTVNEKGEPVNSNVKIEVYRNDRGWWWDTNSYGISNYSSSGYYTLYTEQSISTKNNGKGTYSITIPEQDWGSYEIVATDLASGHIASSKIYVDWSFYSAKSKNTAGKEAVMLSIAADKSNYNTDETAKISFPSSEGGRALISVENGSSVIESFWVKTTQGETVFDLPVTAKMAPNVYINISSIQPHATTINNSPIRLYGVLPIQVYNKKTKLEPEITAPDKLKPEQKFTVKVKEKTGKKMTYTLAIVEDGLLDLTRFKTPNPWDIFYAKTALGVRTWDVYDDVIGAYGGAINQVFSIGGDEDLGAGQVKKANRFKPVVLFEGPFTIEKGKTASHEISLPKYIGSVRVMVVASDVDQKAYGSVEQTAVVSNPLMILGSLPRRAVPGEKVTLPVTVFAMENHVKNVSVKIKTDEHFKIDGTNSQTLTFDEPDEKLTYFDLEVLQKTGVSKIQIEATSGNEKATYEVELDVVNPNPVTVNSKSVVVEPNGTAAIEWEKFGIDGSNKATLELSTFPGINLTSRLNYLISYPHGCSEQITSGVFPQLFLGDFMELSASQKESTQHNVNAGIKKLAERQLADGSFAYWSGSRYFDDWSTSYIGHFFLEAEKRGYALPVGSKANWLAFQQKIARQWRFENRYRNDLAQAYRLYTLALAGKPDLPSMNRLRETKGISSDSKLRLAAAYALSGQKEAAAQLINTTTLDNNNDYFYYGSYERNLAMALEALIISNVDKNRSHEYALELAKSLSSSQWMSTQTTAYALNAIVQYAQKNKSGEGISVAYNFNGSDNSISSQSNFVEKSLPSLNNTNTVSLVNKNPATLYARVAYSGILPVGQENVEESKLSVKTVFSNNGVVINPTTLSQGTEFVCDITITNTSVKGIENIALTQIIPSGWEIVNLRYTDAGGQNNAVDFTDIRDDKTQFYFYLAGNSSKTVRVVLNASYLGHYYMPGIQVNAMYDNSYRCRTKGQWIDVVR